MQQHSQLHAFSQDRGILLDILGNTAPATLKKNLGPWKRWKGFVLQQGGPPAAPTLALPQQWTTSFQERKGLKTFRSMMNFVLFKLRVVGLKDLIDTMTPLWQARAEQVAKRIKQAPALDLLDVTRLEHMVT